MGQVSSSLFPKGDRVGLQVLMWYRIIKIPPAPLGKRGIQKTSHLRHSHLRRSSVYRVFRSDVETPILFHHPAGIYHPSDNPAPESSIYQLTFLQLCASRVAIEPRRVIIAVLGRMAGPGKKNLTGKSPF